MRLSFHMRFCWVPLLFLSNGCRKYDTNAHDLSGNNYIGGVAFLYNDVSVNGALTPLAKMPIKVAYASQPFPNFLFAVSSDSAGGFLLPNLRNGVAYTIFAQDSVGGVKYYGSLNYTLTNDDSPVQDAQLILYVDSLQQNGFIYTVTDVGGNPIKGDTVLIYSSPVLAAVPKAQDTCLGCSLLLTTNLYGKASQFNLPAGNYIAYFHAIFGLIELKGADNNLQIGTARIVRRTVQVQ